MIRTKEQTGTIYSCFKPSAKRSSYAPFLPNFLVGRGIWRPRRSTEASPLPPARSRPLTSFLGLITKRCECFDPLSRSANP